MERNRRSKESTWSRTRPCRFPTAADLAPAAIAVRNASVVASDLVLKRDIYYTQTRAGSIMESCGKIITLGAQRAVRFPFGSPPGFASLANVRSHEYTIGPDRFFMMGDNSPCSKDSRGWGTDDSAWDDSDRKPWEVPRPLLTGKAFYVYWPHGSRSGPTSRYP